MNTDTPTAQDDIRFEPRFLHPRFWLTWLWLGFLWTVTRLPYPWVVKVGRGIGALFYRVASKRRRYAQTNIRLCFPDKSPEEQERIVRESFAGTGVGLLESGFVWWTPFEKLAPRFTVEGLDALLEAKARGEKLLMIGMHNTCMEIGYSFISHTLPLSILFRVNDNPVWEYIARKGRGRYRIRLVPRKQVKLFLDLLDGEGACLLAPDQDLGPKRSLFSPFFNIQTAMVPSVSDFARQKGAKVMMASTVRTNEGYTVKIEPILENFPTDNLQADTDLCTTLIERVVAAHPEQYLWAHRRFKTRPPGEASLYKKKTK